MTHLYPARLPEGVAKMFCATCLPGYYDQISESIVDLAATKGGGPRHAVQAAWIGGDNLQEKVGKKKHMF